MITKAISRAFEQAKTRNWNKTYWAFDVHETVLEPNWSEVELPTKFYPLAKKALQLISQREDVCCILFTCSHPSEIEKYLAFFASHNIHFSYVNENPEVKNKKYGNFSKKPYFNVLFEDKAGFDALTDWKEVIKLLEKKQETVIQKI
ncbi:hypothetical protein JKA74_12080 [Marivirga sp. S37H4]|uniref:Uncharacterized protein n=1 Tax=Marivirga aurantiaca TaxID=2802615 RepID=A0A934WZA8_9BACT|nr:hypothetical protein [Marivirga aurantiaca]MBK6265774.1 hypothetical protein [Marivirga aurantiaca]